MNFTTVARGIWIVPLLFTQLLCAQVITATISGTVTDSTGAVVPGAAVSVRQVETGITHAATTDGAGRYRVSSLESGNYEVSANLTGFQSMVRSGITLSIGREAVVDFALQVGAVAESVTVTGEAPLVNTTNATISQLVSQQALESLPLNGRSFGDLANTQPGVISSLPMSGGDTGSTGGVFIGGGQGGARVLSGTVPQQVTNLLDGIETSSGARGVPASSVSGQQLGVDAVREFSVIQSVPGAQFGRAAGGVVNAVTQSGTNNFHGTAFEFLRNEHLDSRTYFKDPHFDRTPFKRNQFGGTLGGPIKKDQTFFFANYEALRVAAANTAVGSTLTRETRQGNITDATGKVTQTVVVDPNVQPLIDLLPLPTDPIRYSGTGVADHVSTRPYNILENYGTARVDHQLSSKDSFFGRLTIDYSDRTDNQSQILTPVPYQHFQAGNYLVGAVSWTRVLSPTVLSTVRVGLTRQRAAQWQTYTNFGSEFPEGKGLDPRLQAIQGVPLGSYAISGVSVGGIGPGLVSEFWYMDNLFNESAQVMVNRGRHSLTIGADIKRYQDNVSNCSACYGNFSWQTLQRFLTNRPFSNAQNINYTTPGTYYADTYRGYRQTYGAAFVQDDFQLKSNLTLNLGLRWEIMRSPREVNGKLAVFKEVYLDSQGTPLTDPGAAYFAIKSPLAGFTPRVGFAWSPGGSGRTVVRGGAGMYIEPPLAYTYDYAPDNPLISARRNLTESSVPPLKFPFPFGDVALASRAAEPFNVPNDFTEPHSLQWTMSVQQQLGQDWVVKMNYIGMRSMDQLGVYNPNQKVPLKDADGRWFTPATAVGPNPNITGIQYNAPWGDQWYNAGQWVLDKRFSGGLTLNTSYTWSKNLSNFPINPVGAYQIGGGNGVTYNIYDHGSDKGPSPIDARHNWITTVTYQLPLGAGHSFGGQWPGFAQKLLGGWSVNATHTARSGLALAITEAAVQSRCVSVCGSNRPDLIAGGDNNPVLDNWTPDKYFDASQFVLQPLGYFGNVGNGTLTGPGQWTLNLSLRKDTEIAEGKSLSFRAEFFNALNHPNFSPPGTSVFDTGGTLANNVGRITGLNTSMRTIQFGLRLSF